MTPDQPELCGGPTPLGGLDRPCTLDPGHDGPHGVRAVDDHFPDAGQKPYRRFELLPITVKCDDCLWSFEGDDQDEAEQLTLGHITETGHKVRLVIASLVILGPPPTPAAAAPANVDVAECSQTPGYGGWPVCRLPAGHEGRHESPDLWWNSGDDQATPKAPAGQPA